MKVGFYHVHIPNRNPTLPLLMIASVRKVMPDVPIVQFTTEPDMAVDGVTDVRLLPPGPLALSFIRMRAAAGAGNWLFLDTDVIVREDVRSVFKAPFDIAVATREGTMRPHEIGSKFMRRNMHNAGVTFSRNRQFWKDALSFAERMSEGRHAWGCDQEAMNQTIEVGGYQVRVLPNRYNFPPFTAHDDLSDKAILHFKGSRKRWMKDHAA